MAAISFKSVGEETSAPQFQPQPNELPIGIRTPLQLGTRSDGIFKMHFDIADQISDNLRNLLLTNHGERLGDYRFGANLRSIPFDIAQNDFDTRAIVLIRDAISRSMPFIEPQTFESEFFSVDGPNIDRAKIRVTYDVPRLNIRNRVVEATITTGE